MQKERAFVVKALEDKEFHFEGMASTYENADREGDVMSAGCFKNTVETKNVVPMLFNHNRDSIIGKMKLEETEEGLKVKGTFNLKDEQAAKVYDLVKMGAIDSMSIGFMIKDYEPVDFEEPYGAWVIKEAEVLEVSVVTVPCNPKATISSVKEYVKNDKALERFIAECVKDGVEKTLANIQKKESLINRLNEI